MAQTFEKGQAVMVFVHREYGRRGSPLVETWERAVVIDPDAFENTWGIKKDGSRKTRAMVEVEFTSPATGSLEARTYTRRVANAKNSVRSIEDYTEITERNATIKAAREVRKLAEGEAARADRMFIAGRIVQVLEAAGGNKYDHVQALANFFAGEGKDILNGYFVARARRLYNERVTAGLVTETGAVPVRKKRMTVREFLAIPQGERPTMMDAEALWNRIGDLEATIRRNEDEAAQAVAGLGCEASILERSGVDWLLDGVVARIRGHLERLDAVRSEYRLLFRAEERNPQ